MKVEEDRLHYTTKAYTFVKGHTLALEDKTMQGRLVGYEKEKQKKYKGHSPWRTPGSVDGTWLRPRHWEAKMAACGEPVNSDDQQQRRNYQQTSQ
jgi:hypothetical protein